MARFYGSFDSGSVPQLNSDYFDRRRVSADSASGARLRDGLIASRSAVSADVYDDLDSANETSAIGTYFPPDAVTYPTATLMSWSTAYTSSVVGIRTPTANTYGSGVVNYSQRPTASILSTMTQFVTATIPADPVQLNYDVYLSASNAVQTVLNTIQSGSGANLQTPYTRVGNNPSRTFFSIWNDPTMSYFAWDDFTPGTPGQTTPTNQGNGTCQGSPNFYTQPTLRIYYAKQFENDFNPNGKMDITVKYTSNNGGSTQFDGWTGFDVSGSGTSGNYRYIQYVSSVLSEGTGLGDDIIDYNMEVTMSFLDPLITTSRGAYSYFGPVGIINCACASNGSTCV